MRLMKLACTTSLLWSLGCQARAPQPDGPPPLPMADPTPRVDDWAGLSPTDLLLAPGTSLRPPDDMTPSAIADDVRVLRYALRFAWGGWNYVDPNLRDEVDAGLQALARTAPSDPFTFCERVAERLAALPDAHFDASLAGKGRCSTRPPEAGAVGSNLAAGTGRIWSGHRRQAPIGEVAVLAITRFPHPDDPAWDGLLPWLDEAIALPLVIDLRGNSGGNDTYAYWIAESLAGQPMRRQGVELVRSNHPAAHVLVENSVSLQIDDAIARGGTAPSGLQKLLTELAAARTAASSPTAPAVLRFEPGPLRDRSAKRSPHRGPVVVLFDRRCGSSCENAVHLLRQIDGLRTIGENTYGAIHFGQAGRLVLPNSRVGVVIATQYVRFEDGTFREKVGFEPDVRVRPGDDALVVALAELSDHRRRRAAGELSP